MTRQECENMLISLMETANAIYQSFNPQGHHLRMTCVDGQIAVSDAFKDDNGEYTIHTVNATLFPDGELKSWDFEGV